MNISSLILSLHVILAVFSVGSLIVAFLSKGLKAKATLLAKYLGATTFVSGFSLLFFGYSIGRTCLSVALFSLLFVPAYLVLSKNQYSHVKSNR